MNHLKIMTKIMLVLLLGHDKFYVMYLFFFKFKLEGRAKNDKTNFSVVFKMVMQTVLKSLNPI